MIDKIINTIEENSMICEGDKVIVALSGGPDSMSLLHALIAIKDRYKLQLYAAHVNHMLRGEDSDNDEVGCKEFCDKYGVAFFVKRIDIHSMAKERNVSHEMAGRDARYEFFMELKNKLKANKVALAHNLNDQAETILMRMMRGSGLEGLVGIKPVREEIYIRPLINVSRLEIEDYCHKNKLPARVDKTNFENIYSRNRVRLELIPYIEKNFNKDIINTLDRMSNIIKVDEDYINENVVNFFQKYCDVKEDRVIIYSDAFKLHTAILTRIIRKAICEIRGSMYNLEYVHIENIISVQKGDTGKFTRVSKNLEARNVYGNIEILNIINDKNNIRLLNSPLNIGENYIEELGFKVSIKIIDKIDKTKVKGNHSTKYFSYDKPFSNITLRYRREGDRFTSIGMKGSKKLKDLFIDMKIPRENREQIPLLCFDDEISWIIGYRTSEKYKVHDETKKILKVTIERQERHE